MPDAKYYVAQNPQLGCTVDDAKLVVKKLGILGILVPAVYALQEASGGPWVASNVVVDQLTNVDPKELYDLRDGPGSSARNLSFLRDMFVLAAAGDLNQVCMVFESYYGSNWQGRFITQGVFWIPSVSAAVAAALK